MHPVENKILNDLLDKYENSKLSRGENQRAIHIAFPFNKKTMPKYFDESSLEIETIHAAAEQMEREGLVAIAWKNQKPGYIIEKLVLCENHVEEAYEKLGRKPKREAEAHTKQILEQFYQKTQGGVTRSFLSHMIMRLEREQSVKEYLDIMDHRKTEQLIDTLDKVEQNRKECYIREFSIEHFHDSKVFETLIPKICKIFREENEELTGFENEEILAEYQIYKTPGYVYMKGNVQIYSAGKQAADISAFPEGIAVAVGSEEDVPDICPDQTIDKVFTIENLTSFYRFKQEHSLVIYLGGYHNRSRRNLLMQIYQKLPDAQYYHFGDLDAGGFYILEHLKRKTGIPFQMFQMDIETLKKYEGYAKPLTENDKKRLMQLEKMELPDEERKLITYMLQKGIKLEQECISESQ